MGVERARYLREPSEGEIEAAEKIKFFDGVRSNLKDVVRKAGESVLDFGGEIFDTGESKGQDESSLDEEARRQVNNLLDETFPHIDGVRRFELRPISVARVGNELESKKLYFIIDEIDGTTNTKREMAMRPYLKRLMPRGCVSIAVSESQSLADIQAGAIFKLDSKTSYTASHVGGGVFFTYQDDERIDEDTHTQMRGDSKSRIMCIGYSNRNRFHKSIVEYVLFNRAGLVTYGDGSRSSSYDIMNIFRNAYDAYVDLRALWPKTTELLQQDQKGQPIEKENATLQAYDVSAVLPIVLGLGYYASDARGEQIANYDLNSSIHLVVSRNGLIHEQILETIAPLVDPQNQDLIERAIARDVTLVQKLYRQSKK